MPRCDNCREPSDKLTMTLMGELCETCLETSDMKPCDPDSDRQEQIEREYDCTVTERREE